MRTFRRRTAEHGRPFRILNRNLALCSFNQNNDVNQSQNHDHQHDNNTKRQRIRASQFKCLRQSARNAGNNTDRNNQGRTVSNPAGSNLLAQPDNKHRTADQ